MRRAGRAPYMMAKPCTSTFISEPSFRRWRRYCRESPGELPGDGIVFGDPHLVDRHRQELFARVAVLAHGGVVGSQETRRRGVDDPHRKRVRVEQKAVSFLACAQRLFGRTPFRYVFADAGGADDTAVGVAEDRVAPGDAPEPAVAGDEFRSGSEPGSNRPLCCRRTCPRPGPGFRAAESSRTSSCRPAPPAPAEESGAELIAERDAAVDAQDDSDEIDAFEDLPKATLGTAQRLLRTPVRRVSFEGLERTSEVRGGRFEPVEVVGAERVRHLRVAG